MRGTVSLSRYMCKKDMVGGRGKWFGALIASQLPKWIACH